jgi:hypothetical protein
MVQNLAKHCKSRLRDLALQTFSAQRFSFKHWPIAVRCTATIKWVSNVSGLTRTLVRSKLTKTGYTDLQLFIVGCQDLGYWHNCVPQRGTVKQAWRLKDAGSLQNCLRM